MVGFVVVGAQRGQPLIAHQHQEALLGKIGRGGGVEPAGAVLDGIEPVGRDRLTDRKAGPLQRLRRQSFDRVSIDGVKGSGLGCH